MPNGDPGLPPAKPGDGWTKEESGTVFWSIGIITLVVILIAWFVLN